jgi:hypothetical protein
MERINTIQISVQSAEVVLVGHEAEPEIVVNATLMNVARGHMVLRLRNIACDHVGGVGELEIEESRPVMRAKINLGRKQFDSLFRLLCAAPPRPASSVLMLRDALHVSSEGYLSLDDRRHFIIADISWSIPIL